MLHRFAFAPDNANAAYALYLFFRSHPNFLRVQVDSPFYNVHEYEYPISHVLPYGHRVKDGMTPLFSLMASNFPESLAFRDHDGYTPLLHACNMLGRAEDRITITNACHAVRVFVEQFPQAVFLADID